MARKSAPPTPAGEVHFDREAHACWPGGKRLPAVGTILRRAASALNPWAKDDVTPEARARMDRGKTIHETLEMFDKGTLGAYDPGAEPYIAALKAVKAHFGIASWASIEEWRADPARGFWGIADRAHPACGIAELKTGSARPSSYRLAVAGYCLIWGIRQGQVIYLSEAGVFDPANDVEKVTEQDFDAFEMALDLSKRERNDR